MTERFPDGFLWGVATAAYQIEGAAKEDGRGESVWDRFSHTPGLTFKGHTGDVACDHYHRWKEDLELITSLGVGLYRFSIGWSRVLPTGSGRPNHAGLDFYRRLVDRLLELGVAPMVTLNHWDMPQALQDAGGWPARDTASRFAEYADVMFRTLGDRVRFWVTHNEPWMVAAIGHRLGLHAPGVTGLRPSLQAAHHLLLSHGLAVRAYRASGLAAPIGIVLNLFHTVPHRDSAADGAAVIASDGYTNRWYLDPLFKGRYPADTRALFESLAGPLEVVRPGDQEIVAQPIDFLGINYYSPRVVRAAAPGEASEFGWVVEKPRAGYPVTDGGWEIDPNAFEAVLKRVHDDYGPLPLYVTENGAICDDVVGPDGKVHDPDRIRYLRAHMLAARRAIAHGIDLRGYCVWSLMDNFEWSDGYSKRFGIVHVDYPTQRRTPKSSFRFVASVAAGNAVPADGEDGEDAENEDADA
ncbi:GH1 family beta-glucosidase [soil metagenome]